MKKKIISMALLGATTSLMALGAEHAYLYKDSRIMGMGGANVAVGGYSTSVFSNPAGLAKIEKDHGFVVDILGFGIAASEKTSDFASDISDAADSDDTDEMTAVLEKYAGEHFNVSINNYSAVSKNSDMLAWSVGILAASDVNFQTHPNGSPDGGLLATTSRAYGGIVLGVAKPYETEYGRVEVGVGLKFISQLSYEGSLGINELLDEDEDIGEKLQEKYEQESSGFGLDLGVTYHPFSDNYWNPAFGLSILNIGGMDMDDNFGGQPMTVNIGASITPEVDYIDKLVLAIDYVDLFNANVTRIYDYSDSDNVKYTDYEESDFMKRVRLGASARLYDSSYFSATLNLGMYQAAYTAGLDMEITAIKLSFATYEEQVGTGSVDIADRRYMAQIGIGW
ncbi:MAG: conjugal transfer protein TraF [Campylobacterota bacterium]|nr:conjugal transfer protein TraF [Campylobacterota bacterium]